MYVSTGGGQFKHMTQTFPEVFLSGICFFKTAINCRF